MAGGVTAFDGVKVPAGGSRWAFLLEDMLFINARREFGQPLFWCRRRDLNPNGYPTLKKTLPIAAGI